MVGKEYSIANDLRGTIKPNWIIFNKKPKGESKCNLLEKKSLSILNIYFIFETWFIRLVYGLN